MIITGAWWIIVFFLVALPIDGACVKYASDDEGVILATIATLLFLLIGALLWATGVTVTVTA